VQGDIDEADLIACLTAVERQALRFLRVRTDEIYGSLSQADPVLAKTNRYEPYSQQHLQGHQRR
jgi:dTDP-D-glucose 4,6-dehydratase